MREVLVGGEVDPDGPYMYIGGGSVEGEVMVAVNRQFESVTGRVGIVSTADCPENDADLAIKDGDGHVLWSAETGGGPQNFRVRVASLDQVVLYGRVSSSFDAGCYATQVGWAGVEFREP